MATPGDFFCMSNCMSSALRMYRRLVRERLEPSGRRGRVADMLHPPPSGHMANGPHVPLPELAFRANFQVVMNLQTRKCMLGNSL